MLVTGLEELSMFEYMLYLVLVPDLLFSKECFETFLLHVVNFCTIKLNTKINKKLGWMHFSFQMVDKFCVVFYLSVEQCLV